MTPEQAEALVKERLTELFAAMEQAAGLGVDVDSIMGELGRYAIAQAEAAGESVSPLAKMLFG